MEIGIGIPNAVPGTTGPQLLDWARRAESAGFSTLGTIGAVSYPTYEELTVFAAAGAVTERIKFLPDVMISPARSTAELAKQAATVQQLTGGRLTLGVGVGWREPDYVLTGRSFHERGRNLDLQLADLRRAMAGEPLVEGTREVAPDPGPAGLPILVGGNSEAAVRRVVEHGIGWTAGGAPPAMAAAFAEQVRAAWAQAGRTGSPRMVALAYFALGEVEEASRSYLLDYYAAAGPEFAQMVVGGVLDTPAAITAAIGAFTDVGFDEFILGPTVSDPDQVDRLAEVAL